MTICGDTSQSDTLCVLDAAALTDILADLHPSGPAWDAVRNEGTTMRSYWAAFADVLAFFYQRACAYIPEFFCNTVVESTDQWIAEYALGEGCDPYGFNLCAKVTAIGNPTCAGFVELALENGWVIECDDSADDPVAGCFECGCTGMGPEPQLVGDGSNLGFGQLNACDFGEVVDHPEPEFWNTTLTSLAHCPVPGSNLGFGPDDADGESCCMITGWYIEPDNATVAGTRLPTDACSALGAPVLAIINFDCPEQQRPALQRAPCDATGLYMNYSNANVWTVTVDLAASTAFQGQTVDTSPISAAGNFEVGCVPLCAAPDASFILCFLEQIKPAHAKLITKTI